MVEHLVCNQAVVGSNPVASTKGDGIDRPIDTQRPLERRGDPNKSPATQSSFFDI